MKTALVFKKMNSNVVGICLLLALLLGCGSGFVVSDGYYNTKTGEKSSKTEQGKLPTNLKQIEIENQFGKVNLIQSSEAEPSWDWEASCWAETKEAATGLLDGFQLEITGNDQSQSLHVKIPARSSELTGLESNLNLKVPEGIEVKLVNSFGDVLANGIQGEIDATNRHGQMLVENLDGAATLSNSHGNTRVDGIKGPLSFDGSHGDLTIRRIAGDLTVETAHMSIDVADIQLTSRLKTSHDRIVARKINGDLNIENSHGGINATEVSGNVTASNRHGRTAIETSAKAVSVKAAHGSVDISVTNPDFQSIQAETTHDNISLRIPTAATARLEMKTTHGKLKSEIESNKNSDRLIDLKNQHGDIDVRRLSAAALAEQPDPSAAAN